MAALSLLDSISLLPLAAATGGGLAILVLCAIAGIGTVLLLPGNREKSFRSIGGVIVLVAGLIGMMLMARTSAQRTAGDTYFWIFSFIAVICSIRVITHDRPVYSALYFVLAVLATSGLFVLLWAEFMAAALVLIYAGAILITYVFVIMLASQAHQGTTGEVGGADYDETSREPLKAAIVGFAVMGVLLFVIFDKMQGMNPPELTAATQPAATQPTGAMAANGTVQAVGAYLFTQQVINLEVAGIVLTLAMVGAIVIASRRVHSEVPVMHDDVVGPATPINDDPHSIPVYGTDNPAAKAYPET